MPSPSGTPETFAKSMAMVRAGLTALKTGPSSRDAGTRPTHSRT